MSLSYSNICLILYASVNTFIFLLVSIHAANFLKKKIAQDENEDENNNKTSFHLSNNNIINPIINEPQAEQKEEEKKVEELNSTIVNEVKGINSIIVNGEEKKIIFSKNNKQKYTTF